jgi:hypothetical protein
MIIRFKHPYKLHSMWLKKHRDSQFWNAHSQQDFNVVGKLNDKVALNVTISADNHVWRQYQPYETLVLDQLIIPPGMDLDNLFLSVDSNSDEYHIKLQNLKKHPQNYMLEKSFLIR